MSAVNALFPDEKRPPKRSRVEAESTITSHLHQTNLTLLATGSGQGHFDTDVQHSTSSDEDESIDAMLEEEQKGNVMELSSVNRVSYGSVSLIGRRRVMEDAITVAPLGLPCQYKFFGVFDGQGGPWVSMACHERFHLILADEFSRERAGMGVDWSRVMKESFMKMDDFVKEFVCGNDLGFVEDGTEGGDGVAMFETTGSTATLVIVGEEEIVVANCGDSRVVLFSGGVALPLSIDHKPNAPTEQMRLENCEMDVHFDLPVSRSIGHHGHMMKQYIIPDPEVIVDCRRETDEFLIIATHGLWDVVSNEDACAVVKNCLDGKIKRSFEEELVTSPIVAATTLAEFAMSRGSKHNISIVVVEL